MSKDNSNSGIPSVPELFLSFLKLGLTAFGGPAVIPYIEELVVGRNQWLEKSTFKDGVVICQVIPGATGMQVAAYVGLKTKGIMGALASYAGFGLPAFLLMLILSYLYAVYHGVQQAASLFNGLAVIVAGIAVNAGYSFGRNTIKTRQGTTIGVLSAALFLIGVSPFIVLLGTAFLGVFIFSADKPALPPMPHQANYAGNIYKYPALFSVLLLAGLGSLYYAAPKLFSLAEVMLKVDTFAFGGGFASVPLMFHEVVSVKRWMDSGTLMSGIAFGQMTPGPVVITATFVGYLVSGMAGAVVATMAVFTPSFLLLLLATPSFDRIKGSALFSNATTGIFSAFSGFLVFVAVKFVVAVNWDILKILFGFIVLGALVKKVDIIYVVLIGAAASIFLF